MGRLSHPRELQALREQLRRARDPNRPCITVCGGTGCRACGGEELAAAFRQDVRRRNREGEVEVKLTGCHGLCERGPIVVVQPDGVFYPGLKPEDAAEVVEALLHGRVVERLLYRDLCSGGRIARVEEIPFYQRQRRLVLAGNGRIDPTSIADYIAWGGYQALAKALTEMTPEEVIAEVNRSGLRGRGGAGFPTGRKWELCRAQAATPKYVICNGDEGDPGAFMDRSVLEGNPHLVIEGMIIAAYAIGDAREGFVYVRAEYPLAVKHLSLAISQAEELGLLGENILGTGFDFHLEIKRGAGAFVCGESTALMQSIEGKRGRPRQPPPRSVEAGLWGKPTVLNNVKTFALVPLIIERGADWFAGIGTEGSKGTQVFALTGQVQNTGLVEVPMGITIGELVYEIGGGPPEGKRCKAVQIGGPSGGCIPLELFNTPVDFDSLQAVGAMMGSGGLVVLDEDACMVNVARYFLEFTQAESCGQCPPCRVGTKRMLEILNRITAGRGQASDLALLEEVAWAVKEGSLCGLGQTAPNPVLTTLRYFRAEYEAHLGGRCPAGVCQALVTYSISAEECVGCGLCAKVCPQDAIFGEPRAPYRIEPRLCSRCGACLSTCPKGAIRKG